MAHRSSEQDLPDPVYYRHELHAHPELSGQEHVTASTIVEWIEQMLSRYDGSLKTKIVRFKSCTAIALEILASQAGTSTMLRCELDALPIPETITAPYRSQQPERSHRCGHDGHAAIILGVIQSLLGELSVLASGRVVCLFQPAEETGYGAQWVVEADEWPSLRCDCMFALHNVPGLEQGCIYTRAGTLACASRGIHITFEGKHCHAAHPNQGLSPAVAMTEVLQLYGQPDDAAIDTGIVTVTYAQLGTTPNYGICPGEAVIQATLRSTTDEAMTLLVQSVEVELRKIGERHGLKVDITYSDIFTAVVNTPGAAQLVMTSCSSTRNLAAPMRWSEDAGLLIKACGQGAFYLLGAGDRPGLHTEGYDFNDELLQPGIDSFMALIEARHS
eukprot:TRINITY_DN8485_c0_g1_i1.p1 TRINITY_DN8485_c0_g1~~TRINITY_DN8485_c0_g1_i1.p1  ORF type:complete len:388 (+),score=50.68 TRINITY_DN8485_c0_g1_i1:2-1165(+)